MKNKPQGRKSSLSAFFVSMLYGLFAGSLFLFLIVFAGDFEIIWKQAISSPALIVPSLTVGGTVFLFFLFRKRKILSFLISAAGVAAFCGYFVYLLHTPVPFIQLITVRDSAVQQTLQQSSSLFENCVQEGNEHPAVYFEVSDQASMPGDAEKKAIVQMIHELPSALKKQAAGIYFLSENSFNQAIEQETNIDAAGFSRASNFTAAIKVPDLNRSEYLTYFRNGRTCSLSSPESFKETIVHELVHLADVRTHGSTLRISSLPRWKEIYETQKDLFGEYGATNRSEFFAEAGVYYFLYPDLLKEMSPAVYDFFFEYLG